MASFYESGGNNRQENYSKPVKFSASLLILILVIVPFCISYKLVTDRNEIQVFALVLAAVGGILIIARPFWGLVLFVILLYARPEENISGLAGLHLPLIVAVVTAVATVFHKLINHAPLVRTPLNTMIVGFGVTSVLSAIPLGLASVAAQDLGRLVILVFLILNLVDNLISYTKMCNILIFFNVYLSLYSMYLYNTGDIIMQDGIMRSNATGIFSDPNDLAATLVSGLGLTLYRIFSVNKFHRLLYLVACAILIGGVFLTSSRSGFLGLLVILGYFIFTSLKQKLAAIVVAVLVGVGLFAFTGGRMTNFDSQEESANMRFWAWINGVDHLKQNPLLGIGYGGFGDINSGMTAHNSFVLCFTETGLIGYFFWMGCLYLCFKTVIKNVAGDIGVSRFFIIPNVDLINEKSARLALLGFLVVGFWISRTYVPVLYVLIAMSCLSRILNSNQILLKARDYLYIMAIAIFSIVVIYYYSLTNR